MQETGNFSYSGQSIHQKSNNHASNQQEGLKNLIKASTLVQNVLSSGQDRYSFGQKDSFRSNNLNGGKGVSQ
jgi:hypothetical protein